MKQKQPVTASANAKETVVAILRTADEMSRRFTAAVEPHGITMQQFNVLRILRGAGEPLPTMEIGTRMIEKTPGITGLLDRLERKRLIRRTRSSQDRRQVFCTITQPGLRLLQQLDAPIAALDEACVAALSAKKQTSLIQLLEAVRAGVARVRVGEAVTPTDGR